MSEGDTKQSWGARPTMARTVRVVLFLIPLAAGWMAIRLTGDSFHRPPGNTGVAVWAVQAIVVSAVASSMVSLLLRRLTPLPALLGMSLVFPDHAPSRFRVALRAGTIRKLIESEDFALSSDAQEAAEQAVHLVRELARHERLTRGHTERVRAYADVIGQQMRLDDDQLNRLRWGALLHDVGKLKVPAEILSKEGAPTEEEWSILRGHPAAAVEILAPLNDWLGEWVLAASEHHERWDGSGYPLGLAGDEISLAGRITAVADAYDVITAHRSYKQPLTSEEARRELVACAGRQFDPDVVRALLEAGLERPRQVSFLGWLLELPGVARLVDGAVAAPLAAAVSIAAVAGPLSMPVPSSLALEAAAPPTTSSPPAASDPPVTTLGVASGSETNDTSPAPPPSTAQTTSSTSAPAASNTSTAPASSNPPSTTAVPTTAAPATTAPTTTAPATTAPATEPCDRLRAGDGEMSGAGLAGCDLSDLTLDGVDLSGADLSGADLRGLVLTNFNLDGADLAEANLAGARFSDGSMAGADVTDIAARGISLTRVNASGIAGTDADFAHAVLDQVTASWSVLPRSSFQDATLVGVTMTDAQLVDADFSDAAMANTTLDRTDLTSADLSGANASLSLIGQTVLGGADLGQADFSGAFGQPTNSGTASYDDTVCPDGQLTDTGCW